MSISPNAMLIEQAKVVSLFSPATPSTSTSDFISMKGYERVCVLIQGVNGSTVTGSAVTLNQSTDVANSGGKALAFATQYANTDVANSDTLTATTVTSNTFTTVATNSLAYLYAIEVKATDLDIANGFDCFAVKAATGVNTTLGITAILYPAKYGKATPIAAITD